MTYSKMLTLSLMLMLALPSIACAQQVQWHSDLSTARKVAKDNNRPILIDFGTVNCYWCRQLDATTFRDPTVARLLSDKLVAVKIDADKNPGLAQSMGVHAFPTLIFSTPDGKTLARNDGYLDATRFQAQLSKAIAQFNGIQQTQAAQVPVPAPPTKIRMQAPNASSMPPPMARFVLPSPEELGVALILNQATLPQEATIDFDTLFARLRQMGAVGFHLERVSNGYLASINLPGPGNQMTTAEGRGATEGAAIARALANAGVRK